jgi:hypothetical protein
VRHPERDQGLRAGPSSEEQERIKAREREVREFHQANEILQGVGFIHAPMRFLIQTQGHPHRLLPDERL